VDHCYYQILFNVNVDISRNDVNLNMVMLRSYDFYCDHTETRAFCNDKYLRTDYVYLGTGY